MSSPHNDLFKYVLCYLRNDPRKLSDEDRWQKRQKIASMIEQCDVYRIIDTLFFGPPRRKKVTLDVAIFDTWGYIAAMANLPEEMEAIFRAVCELQDYDTTAIIHTFHDAYHFDVIDRMIKNFVFTYS